MQGAVEEPTGVVGSDKAAKAIHFKPILEKCANCERIIITDDVQYCRTYADPAAKWRIGMCNFATHVKPEIVVSKIKINPLKASKRAAAK